MEEYITKVFRSLEKARRKGNRKVLFFANFGAYDDLTYPEVFSKDWDIYLFKYKDGIFSDERFITVYVPESDYDDQFMNRLFKICAPNYYFHDYSIVAYADSNVKWRRSLDALINFSNVSLLFFSHNKRCNVSEEINECLKMGKLRVEHGQDFIDMDAYNSDAKLLLGSVFILTPNKITKSVSQRWFEYFLVAPRDQLGLALVHEQYSENFAIIPFENSKEYFVRTPHEKIPRISSDLNIIIRIKIWLMYIAVKTLNRLS